MEFDPSRDFELALCLTPGVGGATLERVANERSTRGLKATQFFAKTACELRDEFGLAERPAAWLSGGASKSAQLVSRYRMRTDGKPARLLTRESPLYPSGIEEFCKRPPGYLFAFGNLHVLRNETFCVLASRRTGSDDLRRVETRAEERVLAGETIATGANTEAYRRAAVVPLRWGAPRILVLDRGLFCALGEDLESEPFAAARLWRYRFDPQTDLVLSAFRPDDAYAQANNRMRDEQVVALSQSVHVVSATRGGNMDRLSRRAEELGRTVTRDSDR